VLDACRNESATTWPILVARRRPAKHPAGCST